MATRQLVPPVPNFRPIVGTKLFRSSDLYAANEAGIQTMSSLNIRSIIDLRCCHTKAPADTVSILDNFYVPLRMDENTPFYAMDAATRDGILEEYRNKNEQSMKALGLHYYSEIMDADYVRGVFWRCPWYTKPLFGLLILLDRLLGIEFGARRIILWRMRHTGLLGNLKDMAEISGERIYSALRLLIQDTNVPAVVMSTLGKDSTGLISSLIQLICEVDQDTIVQDYVQSQIDWRPHKEQMDRKLKLFGLKPEFGESSAEHIIKFINYIKERYGSVAAFCEVIGFTAEMQIKLRRSVKVKS